MSGRKLEGKIYKRALFLAAGVALGALGATVPAYAQDEDEIVVTAQRRVERQIEVPISLTALTGDQLDRAGIDNVQELAQVTPGFIFEDSLISSGQRARIRGIGSPTFTSGVETSVSVVIDGIVTGPTGSGLSNLFDIERVEVLRGPQGTLFGKNATAGVVSVTTRGPTDEFEAYLNVSRTWDDFNDEVDYASTRVEGAVSGPLGPNTRARLAMFTLVDDEGLAYNAFLDTDENRRNQWGTRFSFEQDIGQWSFDLSAAYIETNDRCCGPTFREIDPDVLADVNNGAPTPAGFGRIPTLIALAAANGIEIGPENRTSMASDRVGESTTTAHVSLTSDYEFDNGFVFRSITGYRHWASYGEDDSERMAVDIADATFGDIDLKIFSEELQLISPDEGRFNYVLGLYYYDQRLDDTFRVGGALGTANPLQAVSTAQGIIDVTNWAVFANATYDLTDSWELLGGVRLLHEEQSLAGVRVGTFFGANRPYQEISVEDDDWVGRAGIRYSPNRDLSLFATVSRGYKGSGLNNSNSGPFYAPANSADPILDPETVMSYEVGWKQRWFGGALETNIVAYHSEFQDFQTSAFDGASNTFSLRNAGVITLDGVEIDATARPWEGATFTLGAAYIEAIFDEFTGAPCTAIQSTYGICPPATPTSPAGQDLSGRAVDGAPELQISFSGRQDFSLGSFGAYVGGDVSYRSEVNYNSDLDPMLVQEGFSVANFRAGIMPNDNLEIVGFVENAFDETYALRISPAPLLPGVTSHYLAPGRTIGVELRLTR
ncbi:MAG: TonB-dependent receptor [Hyphomonadaceae bacterium JAD_PAG50586_4]|nr:MAG: TonB-dependent receptor [Hyphomonadaceae bacterium JAD_PAG50586_4]